MTWFAVIFWSGHKKNATTVVICPQAIASRNQGVHCLLSDRLTDVVTVRVEDAVQVVTLVMGVLGTRADRERTCPHG